MAERPRKRMRLSLDACWTFSVADRTFAVPRALVAQSSAYYKKLDDGSEGQESKYHAVELRDIHPDTFEIYVQWLYTGVLDYLPESQPLDDLAGQKDYPDGTLVRLLNLYVLADRFLDISFQNEVMDAFLQVTHSTRVFPVSLAGRVYTDLPVHSKMRLYFVDEAALGTGRAAIESLADATQYRHGFLHDVLLRCWDVMESGYEGEHEFDALVVKCRYHTHNQDVPECTDDSD